MATVSTPQRPRRQPATAVHRVQDRPRVATLYGKKLAMQERRAAAERERTELLRRVVECGPFDELAARAAAAREGVPFDPSKDPAKRLHELRMESAALEQAIQAIDKEITLASLEEGSELYAGLYHAQHEARLCRVRTALRELGEALGAEADFREELNQLGIPTGAMHPVSPSMIPDLHRLFLRGGVVEFFLESAARYLPKE